MAQHRVVAAALDDVEEAVGVALDALHAVGDAGLGGAALQREQRVRAGVDDGDAVAEAGDGHREVAAAASGVEDVQRLPARGLDPAVEGVLGGPPRPRRYGGRRGGGVEAACSSAAARAAGDRPPPYCLRRGTVTASRDAASGRPARGRRCRPAAHRGGRIRRRRRGVDAAAVAEGAGTDAAAVRCRPAARPP